MRSTRAILAAGLVALGIACANPAASAPTTSSAAPATVEQTATGSARVNGIVERASKAEVILQGGEQFAVRSDVVVIRSVAVDSRLLQQGAFVAVTAKRQPDNTLVASVVNIFPESMRGLNIGQRPMDAGNLMTNATIDEVEGSLAIVPTTSGVTSDSFMVSFPGGSDRVRLAEDVKVNQFHAAGTADLSPGTPITASVNNGSAQFITIQPG